MVDGCNAIAAGRHFEEMAAERDRAIVAILKVDLRRQGKAVA